MEEIPKIKRCTGVAEALANCVSFAQKEKTSRIFEYYQARNKPMKKIDKPRCDGCFYWECGYSSDHHKIVEHGSCYQPLSRLSSSMCGFWCSQWRDKNPPYNTLQNLLDYYGYDFGKDEKTDEKNTD